MVSTAPGPRCEGDELAVEFLEFRDRLVATMAWVDVENHQSVTRRDSYVGMGPQAPLSLDGIGFVARIVHAVQHTRVFPGALALSPQTRATTLRDRVWGVERKDSLSPFSVG